MLRRHPLGWHWLFFTRKENKLDGNPRLPITSKCKQSGFNKEKGSERDWPFLSVVVRWAVRGLVTIAGTEPVSQDVNDMGGFSLLVGDREG